MDHGLELISPGLEILEIEVSNILYNLGNIGNLSFSIVSDPGNIGNQFFPISDMVEMRAAGGRLQGLGSGGLGLFLEHGSWNFRISWKYWKYAFNICFHYFSKKDAHQISRRTHQSMSRDLSYKTDSGPKN